MIKRNFFLIFIVISVASANGQDRSGVIIDELLKKFRSVKSYTAEAVIKPEISFLKILPHRATVYFMQPDKFRMKTEGISILPKQNLENVFTLLNSKDSYSAVATESADTAEEQITVIPVADTSDLILAKLWIDSAHDVINKARLTTRSSGTVFIEYKYDKYLEYGLPDQITFIIDVKKFKIPKAIAADINTSSGKSDPEQQQKPGYIYVNLNNYKINQPIPENIFK